MDKNTINDIANKLKDIKGDLKDINIEHEELNEAVEVNQSDIEQSDIKRIKELEKLFTAKFIGFHYGGHGAIVDMDSKKPFHSVSRTSASEWESISKAIKKLQIRWIEINGNRVSVGLESINEY